MLVVPALPVSQCIFSALIIANPNHFIHSREKNLSVTNLASAASSTASIPISCSAVFTVSSLETWMIASTLVIVRGVGRYSRIPLLFLSQASEESRQFKFIEDIRTIYSL